MFCPARKKTGGLRRAQLLVAFEDILTIAERPEVFREGLTPTGLGPKLPEGWS